MAGPYAQQTWVDGSAGGTPISAARLGVIEQGLQDNSYINPTYVCVQDEFLIANTVDNRIGEMGWREAPGAGNGTNLWTDGVTDHYGIVQITSGVVANVVGGISNSNTSSNKLVLPPQLDRMIFIMRPVTSVAAVNYRFGLFQDYTNVTGGTNGAWWDYAAASNANWRSITRGASVNTTNNTSVAVTAGNWYKLELRKNGSNWEFRLNDTLQFTHSTNLPSTTTALHVAMVIEPTTTTAKIFEIDYFGMQTIALGNRYT